MVGEKIDEDDPSWANFLLLLTIADYVLAPVTSQDMVAYLRVLIDDHHQAFRISTHTAILPLRCITSYITLNAWKGMQVYVSLAC